MLNILKHFKIEGNLIEYVPYGEGHINDTYLVTFDNEGKNNQYILQKINHQVFKNIEGLMNNINYVTTHLKSKMPNCDPREVLTVIKTYDNKNYYFDGNDYYRVYIFIQNSITLQQASSKELFKESAIAFGKFQNILSDFDATLLVETIKDFHNSEVRFAHFIETLKQDKYDRAKHCQKEIDFILKRKDDCSKIINLIKENKIPLKVTHNDTKLNNVLLDSATQKALCVIDLDTVMPGSSLYDFGDSIRFGCNTAKEDETNLQLVNFSLEYFKAFAEGYLSEVKNSLNKYEIENLAFSAKLMTLECGIRFLDDYLDGDHYFKIHRENHNLDRCRTQLKLVEEMEKLDKELNNIIFSLI